MIKRFIAQMQNPIRRYIDAPKAGRLSPQPNEDMAMTRLVKWMLLLR